MSRNLCRRIHSPLVYKEESYSWIIWYIYLKLFEETSYWFPYWQYQITFPLAVNNCSTFHSQIPGFVAIFFRPILIEVGWKLKIVLICISLITKKIKHLKNTPLSLVFLLWKTLCLVLGHNLFKSLYCNECIILYKSIIQLDQGNQPLKHLPSTRVYPALNYTDMMATLSGGASWRVLYFHYQSHLYLLTQHKK